MYNSQETALRIKNIAKSKSISIAELQAKCGLGKNAISQLSDSQEGMKSKNIYMIAEYLDVSVDYLLGRTDSLDGYYNHISNVDTTINGTQENIIHSDSTHDTMTEEFMKLFHKLSIEDKIVIMNLALEKTKETHTNSKI
ncbi:MAG: helix-turn-helix domain-containing protein [Ruminococcus sp.]|nr:helix-turn-helix domain-containing protein [Ruminococcus sp.]